MHPFLKRIKESKWLRNKYFIALVLFGLWIGFFDQNNLIQNHRNRQRLKALKEQRIFFREKIESDNLKMEELRSGVDNLEKYAREQFNMSRPDEDLFLVVEE